MDHSEDATHGQQELSFYNHHHYHHHYCYLPLFVFEGISGKFISAVLRPGKRPKGAENAMLIKRILKRLRAAWPQTHILLRGDGHFSNPELMQLALDDPYTDFIFGLTGNSVLLGFARPFPDTNRYPIAPDGSCAKSIIRCLHLRPWRPPRACRHSFTALTSLK